MALWHRWTACMNAIRALVARSLIIILCSYILVVCIDTTEGDCLAGFDDGRSEGFAINQSIVTVILLYFNLMWVSHSFSRQFASNVDYVSIDVIKCTYVKSEKLSAKTAARKYCCRVGCMRWVGTKPGVGLMSSSMLMTSSGEVAIPMVCILLIYLYLQCLRCAFP